MNSSVKQIIKKEQERQINTIDLIASENYVSQSVLDAVGSVMTNKYAEGYPRKRYYQGCKFVDEIEQLAIDRAKELFGVEYVNVQPYSGSTANMAVLFGLLKPGEKIMGMTLSSGGHLTHGAGVSFSGTLFQSLTYGVDVNTGLINYDEVDQMATAFKPNLIICGYTAYPGIIDFERFSYIAKKVGAYLVADISHIAGLVAAGVHPSPVEYADVITSTTHKTLRGPRGAIIMSSEEHKDTLQRAVFPFMQGGPFENIIAGKAVAFYEALQPKFKEYASQIVKNSKALNENLVKKGYKIVGGISENHLFVMDLSPQQITGKDLAKALEDVGIIVSKANVPEDKLSPFITSGVRIGTPAVTTRNMKEKDMLKIADFIDCVVKNINNKSELNSISLQVHSFISKFPIPKEFI